MQNNSFKLPPMASLLAFEAAGRLSSFRQAADELSVTPSAISHQIKARIVLLGALQTSLANVSSVIEQLRHGGEHRPVTICSTTAISSLWLTPRLSQFWKAHGNISVNQHVADAGPARGMAIDLQIWYGKKQQSDTQSRLLFKDRLLPVCSAAFAAGLVDRSLDTLAKQPLIHLDTVSQWTNWATWFNGLGYYDSLPAGMRVNNYTIAVQAARDDVGILLGWERLLAPIIERGLLVTLDEHVLEAPGSFYLTSVNDGGTMREPVRLLHDWLLA